MMPLTWDPFLVIVCAVTFVTQSPWGHDPLLEAQDDAESPSPEGPSQWILMFITDPGSRVEKVEGCGWPCPADRPSTETGLSGNHGKWRTERLVSREGRMRQKPGGQGPDPPKSMVPRGISRTPALHHASFLQASVYPAVKLTCASHLPN